MFVGKTVNRLTKILETKVRSRLRRFHANGSRRDTLDVAEVTADEEFPRKSAR